MIDFCTVVVLDFRLKKAYLQANSLHMLTPVTYYVLLFTVFRTDYTLVINTLQGFIFTLHTSYSWVCYY